MSIQSNELNRRGFLKASAFAGAALALPPFLAACAPQQSTGSSSAGKRLRIGVLGGGNSESLDFNHALGESDVARTAQIFEGLTYFDSDGTVKNRLAESLEANADGTVWTVRLKSGVVFHSGKKLDGNDVLSSMKYLLDPANKTDAAALLEAVDLNSSRVTDPLTVVITLKRPNFLFPTLLGERAVMIMPAGTPDFKKPVGTGPFAFKSFTVGDRSLFTRFADYHGGPALVEELEIISINDATARLNALRSNTVDAIAQVAPQLIKTVTGGGINLLKANSGSFPTIYTRLSQGPFTDPRVPQALKLAVDRQQMIDNSMFGAGSLGNDLPSPFDPYYAKLPQRTYDPEKAKFLLKQAGYDRLPLELHTSDASLGMLESATLFASQAKNAGFDIALHKWPTSDYWSRAWLKESFACSFWGGRPLISQLQLSVLPGASYNETDWNRPDFNTLVENALANPNEDARKTLLGDAQKMLFDDDGHIIWGFTQNVDAVRSAVTGITPSAIRPLGNYDFRAAKVAS